MAHKKGGGATGKNRDSAGRRLGVKVYGGQVAISGQIIARQRGTKYYPGEGTLLGRDHTIFATREGTARFKKRAGRQIVEIV